MHYAPFTMPPLTSNHPLAIYIHWPFCKAKCPYCDFNSHVRNKIEDRKWREALLRDMEYAHSLTADHCAVSIFFGGGTPSLMNPDTVAALIEKARSLWKCEDNLGKDNLEITLEANPTSTEADNFKKFSEAGVNRVSIGVQSLRQEALKFLGREHSAKEAVAAINLARRYFSRYSFDLIYARPDQTVAAWKEELGEALELAGGHISLYQLAIEENTAFYTSYYKGEFILPEDEAAAAMYELTSELTAARGLKKYEISNYAVEGEESRHNLAYWRGFDYVGIGAGAHGRISCAAQQRNTAKQEMAKKQRTATLAFKSPERWLEAVETSGNGIESSSLLSARTCAEERFIMGMRLSEGLAVSEVHDYLDYDKMQLAIEKNLLEANPDRLIATAKGSLVLTSLIAMLIKAPQ